MDIRKVKDEMQFLTGVITNDMDYLLYLLLKKDLVEDKVVLNKSSLEEGYMKEKYIEDWFNEI